jgi:hypothetical protein
MNKKGSIEIIVMLGMVGLLMSLSIVVDVGNSIVRRVKLENALEAASIAGAYHLIESEQNAINAAKEYLTLNGEDADSALITISDDSKAIQVESTIEVNNFISRIVGINSNMINAKSKAMIGPIKSISNGVRPLGVELFPYSYGQAVVLKEDAGDGIYGNYGSVALGGTGASVYTDNLLYGYDGTIEIGQLIPTEPGNKTSAVNQLKNYLKQFPETFENFEKDSNKLWVLPLVENYNPKGRDDLKVVGFAKFFIEDIKNDSGNGEITGRFVEFVDSGVIDPNLDITGLYGVKLTR